MIAIDFADVAAAAQRVAAAAHRTPVHTSRTLDRLTGRQLLLKCESLQRTGSFKFRGAYNAISQLNAQQRARGVVAYSSGNHAQGVALAAQLLGVPAIICMPDNTPQVKAEATQGYGAEVLRYSFARDDRAAFAQRVADERGMTIIPPYDHPQIMAGQGTAALELLEEVPDLDALVTPVGGGGLLSGCAVAAQGMRPQIRLFGVETVGADDTQQSFRRGERVCVPPPHTIADGIRTQSPGALTFPVLQRYVDDVLVVDDAQVLEALRLLLLRAKLLVEPTGAVALAAVLQGMLPASCRRVGVILSGGNVDPSLLASILAT